MPSTISLAGGVVLALALASSCRTPDSAAASVVDRSTTAASASANGAPSANIPSLSDTISARADRGRIAGSAAAKVWIIEASDFQCPFCKTWHDATFTAIERDYVRTGAVRIAYVNFPLRQHQHALEAAEAAMCASVQDKFWQMHESLFGSQAAWESLPSATSFFDSLATRAGVAISPWRDCVARHLTRPLIDADVARAQSSGVQSTPTFFIGDQKVEGAQPLALFREVIEAQLAKAKGASQKR